MLSSGPAGALAMSAESNTTGSPVIHDVLIVGSGPAGLAVAARLRERYPEALFTDEEHRRHCRPGGLKSKTSHMDQDRNEKSIVVLDGFTDRWLGRWNYLFEMYDIKFLRSPMFFHIDPQDRDSLIAQAIIEDRQDEMHELEKCVGTELNKSIRRKRTKGVNRGELSEVIVDERDRQHYFTPSTGLFNDHCAKVAKHYGLSDQLIRQESVQDIDFNYVNGISEHHEIFTVRTNKSTHLARSVVLAVGPASAPFIPNLSSLIYKTHMATDGNSPPNTCHSMNIKVYPDPALACKINNRRETNVLVIGGGLTSCQLGDLAIRRGVTKVWHLMRGPLKINWFDIGLEWLGRYKEVEQSQFWAADTDEERWEIIRKARNGGSVPPFYVEKMKNHQKRGRLSLHKHTVLSGGEFDEATGQWRVQTEPAIPELPPMDFIYFATGVTTETARLPYLQTMFKKYPIPTAGGLPCLSQDMMWKEGVPLFCAGRLGSLRIGPGGQNLIGCRLGAERIVGSLERFWEEQYGKRKLGNPRRDALDKYNSGHFNRFDALEDIACN